MQKKMVLLLMFISVNVSALTTEVCVKTDKKVIEGLFDRWNDSLQTGDAHKVAENYLSDAVLLPTLSNKVRVNDSERVDYFEHFLAKKPVGKIESRTIRTGCNKATDNGIYSFTFADNSVVKARYTFTYRWDGRTWKISSHHSSVMPEG